MKAVLVNVFGGILRCDIIALGMIDVSKNQEINVPIVVRMRGTNGDEGKKLLADSGLPVIMANDLDEAASKVVAAAKGKAG